MRLFASAPTLIGTGVLVWGCSVYDSDLVPSNSSLVGSGDTSAIGGRDSTNSGGGTSNVAGKTTTGGTTSDVGGSGTTTAGTGVMPSDGGAGNEGGDDATGVGGTSGSGGATKGGSGGTASGGKGSGGTTGSAGTGGNGGSGGSAPVVKCADHPIPLKTMWVPTASSSSIGTGVESDGLYNPPTHMTDGSYIERWSSGKPQSGDEWIQIDFGAVVTMTTLTLNGTSDPGDYPRSYAVRLTDKVDPTFTGAIRASGNGSTGDTLVTFPAPITGRYLTVRQTGVDAVGVTAWWTITEVLVGCTDP